jgi:DNA gyrase subunit B
VAKAVKTSVSGKTLTTKKTKTKRYEASDIAWHRGLDGPRNDPSMYLGSADGNAVVHMSKEVVGNSVDEVQSGHGSFVRVVIDDNNTVTVSDDGRGVPTAPHPLDKKRSTMDIVFSELHAGGKGKGSGDAYDASIGTHGLGAAVTNACSELFHVTVKRESKVHEMSWGKGKVKKPYKVTGKCPKTETGTTVKFRHDPTVLTGKPNWKKLIEWIEALSYFTPKVTYYLDIKPLKLKTKIRRKHGLQDWLADNAPTEEGVETITKPIILQTKAMDLALQWFGKPDDGLRSFVSAVETVDGGTHRKAVERAISDVLDKFCGKRGALKKAYKPEDLRSGLVGCVNIRMKAPKFANQTKERLVSPEGDEIVYADAVKELTTYFAKHKKVAQAIIERANRLRSLHNDHKLSAAAASKITGKRGAFALPAKLRVSICKDRSKVELYIVEGDSAGGSAKQASDVGFQEILPLKGKPPNILKGNYNKNIENDEIINILRSIGYDPRNKENPLAKMRVGKIILLADSDVDGQHITNLLLALIWTLTPELIKDGKVFIVSDALYMAKSATKTVFGKTRDDAIKMLGAKPTQLTRIKGWGELSPPDMKPHVFVPETRQHILVTPNGAERLLAVMGEDVAVRKRLLNL